MRADPRIDRQAGPRHRRRQRRDRLRPHRGAARRRVGGDGVPRNARERCRRTVGDRGGGGRRRRALPRPLLHPHPRRRRPRLRASLASRCARWTFDAEGELEGRYRARTRMHVLDCDTVIFSIGQRAGLAFIPPDAGVDITRQRPSPSTPPRSRPRAPACSRPATPPAARHSSSRRSPPATRSRRASTAICRASRWQAAPEQPVAKNDTVGDRGQSARAAKSSAHTRVPMPMPQPARDGAATSPRSNAATPKTQAQAEAARCLSCGLCSECLSCVYACGAKAIDHDEVERIEEHPGRRRDPRARLPSLQRRAVAGIRLRTLPQRRHVAAVRAIAVGLRPDRRSRAAPVRRQDPQEDRLPAVRRLARPDARLLLGGVLHVCGQRSHHGQGARAGHRRARVHDGHARLQQGLPGLLSARP